MSRLSDRILKKINEEEEKEPGYNVKKRTSQVLRASLAGLLFRNLSSLLRRLSRITVGRRLSRPLLHPGIRTK